MVTLIYTGKIQIIYSILLPHDCRFAAANEKPLPLCCGKSKVRQNDKYMHYALAENENMILIS